MNTENKKSITKTGRPKLPWDVATLRNGQIENYIKSIARYAAMTKDAALAELQQNEKLTMLDEAIICCFLHCIKSGDWNKLDSMMSRVVGKQAETININSSHESIVDIIQKHVAGEIVV